MWPIPKSDGYYTQPSVVLHLVTIVQPHFLLSIVAWFMLFDGIVFLKCLFQFQVRSMVKWSPSHSFSSPKTEPASGTILRGGDLATGSDLRPGLDAEAAHRLADGPLRAGVARGPLPDVPDRRPVDQGPQRAVLDLPLGVRRPRGLARR